jgi:hypothetical protein
VIPINTKALEPLAAYFKAYGGVKGLIQSPFLHASFVLAVFMHNFWRTDSWAEISIEILPNLIGFSLGGYAIWLAIGNDSFRALLSTEPKGKGPSPFIRVSSVFAHFIVVQLTALVYALVYQSSPILSLPMTVKCMILDLIPKLPLLYDPFNLFVGYVGTVLMIYGLTTALAATLGIFRISRWLSIHSKTKPKKADVKNIIKYKLERLKDKA